ncbi:hypothetical protein F0562_019806 [Nyssa sinensis]|uniref:Uncharacterized protein n=1 Tax=Nyssa sinensis TaxID=561372 RepID=A0A5J5BT75_9ASTE|nr:hypothetical protein F0562_019806 [Nyssa sinensis]
MPGVTSRNQTKSFEPKDEWSFVIKRPNLVKAEILNGIDNLINIKATPRSLQHGPTHPVPVVHKLRIEAHGLAGIEPSVPCLHAIDLTHSVQLPQPHHQLPNHCVHSRAEPSARDDGCTHVGWVKEDQLAGTGTGVGKVGRRRRRVEVAGEVEHGLTEDYVGRGEVELVGWMVELIVLQWVGDGLEVWEVVGQVGEFDRREGQAIEMLRTSATFFCASIVYSSVEIGGFWGSNCHGVLLQDRTEREREQKSETVNRTSATKTL